MKNFLFLLILTVSILIQSQAQGIEFFHGKWEEALAKAKLEDKILFVDSYAEWCGPCKSMAKNVFTKEDVGEFFNTNFINLKLDMEKADGLSFGQKYFVRAYPTLFFIDGDGKVVKTVVGGQSPTGLIEVAIEAMKNNDRSGKYAEQYEKGDRSYDLVFNYVKALNAAGKPSLKISNDYLKSTPTISQEEKLKFLFEAAIDSDSKIFDQLVENKEDIIKLVGQKIFYEKCKAACQKGVNKAIEFETEELLYQSIAKAQKTLGKEESERWGNKSEMEYFRIMKNKAKYQDAYKALAKGSSKDAQELRFIANNIMRYYKTDKSMLDDGSEYIVKSHDIKPSLECLSELVNILVQNNEVKKAIKIVSAQREKAIEEKQELGTFDMMLDFLNSKKTE